MFTLSTLARPRFTETGHGAQSAGPKRTSNILMNDFDGRRQGTNGRIRKEHDFLFYPEYNGGCCTEVPVPHRSVFRKRSPGVPHRLQCRTPICPEKRAVPEESGGFFPSALSFLPGRLFCIAWLWIYADRVIMLKGRTGTSVRQPQYAPSCHRWLGRSDNRASGIRKFCLCLYLFELIGERIWVKTGFHPRRKQPR